MHVLDGHGALGIGLGWSTAAAIFGGTIILVITPENALTFGTVAMLFATPVSVIISTVMANRAASKAAAQAVIVAAKADSAAKKVEVVAVQTAKAADLLVASNDKIATTVAETTKSQGAKLDQIHILVNSNMTASMQSELDYARANLVLLLEVAALRKAQGEQPSIEATGVADTTRKRIAELEAQLDDRLKTTKIADDVRQAEDQKNI